MCLENLPDCKYFSALPYSIRWLGLHQRKNRGQEIKINHWPKKHSFWHFSAAWHRKLWPGFTICSSEAKTQSSGPPDSCWTLAETYNTGDISGLTFLHAQIPGFEKEGQTLLLSMINPTCVKSLINNHANQLINKHPSPSLSLREKVGAFKSNR